MEKIKAEHIEYMINKLIGDIRVACETNHDNKVEKNLNEYAVIFNWLLDELIECAKWRNDGRISAKACGKQAYEILEEVFDTLKDEMGKDYIPVEWIDK